MLFRESRARGCTIYVYHSTYILYIYFVVYMASSRWTVVQKQTSMTVVTSSSDIGASGAHAPCVAALRAAAMIMTVALELRALFRRAPERPKRAKIELRDARFIDEHDPHCLGKCPSRAERRLEALRFLLRAQHANLGVRAGARS